MALILLSMFILIRMFSFVRDPLQKSDKDKMVSLGSDEMGSRGKDVGGEIGSCKLGDRSSDRINPSGTADNDDAVGISLGFIKTWMVLRQKKKQIEERKRGDGDGSGVLDKSKSGINNATPHQEDANSVAPSGFPNAANKASGAAERQSNGSLDGSNSANDCDLGGDTSAADKHNPNLLSDGNFIFLLT